MFCKMPSIVSKSQHIVIVMLYPATVAVCVLLGRSLDTMINLHICHLSA